MAFLKVICWHVEEFYDGTECFGDKTVEFSQNNFKKLTFRVRVGICDISVVVKQMSTGSKLN